MKKFHEYKQTKSVNIPLLLFEARQKAHQDHLKTKSYAEHKALDVFYNELLELADEFIETYQGQYGIVELPESLEIPKTETISYLNGFVEQVKEGHKNLDSHLQNILDEIVALTYRTLYKLKYLK